MLARNSPLVTLPHVARQLRREQAFVWFYTGSADSLLRQNERFDAALRQRQVKQAFFVVPGGHTWAQWRKNAWQSIEVASAHLAHG